MKKIVFGLIGCFFLTLPAVSLGATGWYGSINIGVTRLSDSDINATGTAGGNTVTKDGVIEYGTGHVLEASLGLGAGIGYIFDNFRIEGKISYQDNDIDEATTKSVTLNGVDQGLSGPEMNNGSINILTFMANGYFDFNNNSNFTPYLTAGMGMANVEIDGTSTDDTVFAYQIGAGVGYALSETVSIDGGYRYLGTTDYEYAETLLSVPIKAEDYIGSHNFTVGMRFAF